MKKLYLEHTAAYDDWFSNLAKKLTFKDVMRLMFKVDLTKEKLQNDLQYENFAMNYFWIIWRL